MASATQTINADPILSEPVAVGTPVALNATEDNSEELMTNEPTEVPNLLVTAAQNGDTVVIERYSFCPLYPLF
jgi:hypothetical protein